MNNPIFKNREWIFSGIGVLAISLLISLGVFIFRKTTSVDTKQQSQPQVLDSSSNRITNTNSHDNTIVPEEGQAISGSNHQVGNTNSQVTTDTSQSVNGDNNTVVDGNDNQLVDGNHNQVIGNIEGTEGDVNITQNNSTTQYRSKFTIQGETPNASVSVFREPTDNPFNSISKVFTDLQNGEPSSPDDLIDLLERHNTRVTENNFMVTSGTEVKVLGATQKVLNDQGLFANMPPTQAENLEKVMSAALTLTHVEILSGQHKGKTGWIISHLIEEEEVPVTSKSIPK